jgi:hypothetical protein
LPHVQPWLHVLAVACAAWPSASHCE